MRKVVVFCHLSLDGVAAVQSGRLDWVTYDKELEKWAEPIVAETDTALYGRVTYELMKYWRTVSSNPKAIKHELKHTYSDLGPICLLGESRILYVFRPSIFA